MNRILSSLTALAIAAPTLGFAAEATNAYPRLSGDASSQHVEYAAGDVANVVGGGIAVFAGSDDQRPVLAYGRLAQRTAPAQGSPVFVGVDDGRPVFAYGPAQDASSAFAARAAGRAPRG